MKKLIGCLCLAFLSVGCVDKQERSRDYNAIKEDYRTAKGSFEQLKLTVEGLNSTLPQQVNENVELVKIVALPNMEMSYQYRLINVSKGDGTLSSLPAEEQKQQTLNVLKTSPDSKFYKDNNVSFSFDFYDKDMNFVYRIKISPSEYK